MTARERILSRFAGAAGDDIMFLPDLTLWYAWHNSRASLPAAWDGYSLSQIAAALGIPVWASARPWRAEYPGIEVTTEIGAAEKITRYATPAGTLTPRWTLGPDGDWWQAEYLIKTPADLPAGRAVVEALTYSLDVEHWAWLNEQVGDAGVVALELPRRPYSDLLHDFLGWGEGLMLLMGDGRPALLELLDILERKLQGLVAQIAGLPGALALAPDNLDGQYISPRVFAASLADSYRRSAETLGAAGKRLVVHIGGPARRIVGPLAAAGVAAIEGIAGPPQGDLTLAEARATAGPDLVIWGGVPQDFLVETIEEERFESSVRQALEQAAGDPRMILGVADRVPVNAHIGRLKRLIEMAH